MSCSPRLFVAISLVALTAVACSGGGGGARTLAVTSTDTACDLSRSTVDPGKVEVTVTNKGQDVTEVYVYAANDRPLGEVEHIQPGAKGTFTADVGGGDYQVACKPGEKGDGIRSALHVTGPAASTASLDAASSDRATDRGSAGFSMALTLADGACQMTAGVAVVKGQTITFEVTSTDTSQAFKLLGPDGSAAVEQQGVLPGSTARINVTFTALGTYRCVGSNADVTNSPTLDVID